ncbi:MAG: hypothetical protein HPY53_11105 [Brevinematales bacterium]|nr:hypothetical protein [Brevinematales bacterium]
MKIKKVVFLLILFAICGRGWGQVKTDFDQWVDSWNNIYQENKDGVTINKKIKSQYFTPTPVPTLDDLVPQFGPFGFRWDSQLAVNGARQFWDKTKQKLESLVDINNIDMLVSIAGNELMKKIMSQSIVEQINDTMQLIQGADNLYTKILNNRYQLAYALIAGDDMELYYQVTAEAQANGGDVGPDDTLQKWQKAFNDVLAKKMKIGVFAGNADIANIYNGLTYLTYWSNLDTEQLKSKLRLAYGIKVSGNKLSVSGLPETIEKSLQELNYYIESYIDNPNGKQGSTYNLLNSYGVISIINQDILGAADKKTLKTKVKEYAGMVTSKITGDLEFLVMQLTKMKVQSKDGDLTKSIEKVINELNTEIKSIYDKY